MNFGQSILMGLLQGLCEFLPISSSGHLLLAHNVFGIEGGLFFDVMLHLATLAAVVVEYFTPLKKLFVRPLKNDKLVRLISASVPTFAIAAVFKFFVDENVFSLLLPIGFALTLVVNLAAFFAEKYVKAKPLFYKPFWVTLVCGALQGVAVFPGLSRSGTTISTLLVCGVKREDATEFSFLLSIPVILASAAVECLEVFTTNTPTVDTLCLLCAMVTAFISGTVALKLLKNVLKGSCWLWFAVYTVVPLCLSLLFLNA